MHAISSDCQDFLDFVDSHGLKQQVLFPTRTSDTGTSNFLDVVFCSGPSICHDVSPISPLLLSDHLAIKFILMLPSSIRHSTTLRQSTHLLYRKCNFKELNAALLRFNLGSSVFIF
uniref:Endo/exonuclease/phosphatase domain-containing protein n=1 Tax=Caenorhabditis japonica TaxID=281687 RepID=A0A8R1EMP4_CAEJA